MRISLCWVADAAAAGSSMAGVRRRGVADADAAGPQPRADAMAPLPARQGPAATARRAAVRALLRLPAAALAAAAATAAGGSGHEQRLFLVAGAAGGQEAAAVPGLLRGDPARPRAVAAARRGRRGRDTRAPGGGAAARVDASDHHGRGAAAARGPLLRLRPEPRALHGVEPSAADAPLPRPRPRR